MSSPQWAATPLYPISLLGVQHYLRQSVTRHHTPVSFYAKQKSGIGKGVKDKFTVRM